MGEDQLTIGLTDLAAQLKTAAGERIVQFRRNLNRAGRRAKSQPPYLFDCAIRLHHSIDVPKRIDTAARY